MWDFNIRKALILMMQTWPFLGLRLVVYIGVALGYMLTSGLGAGMGYGVGTLIASDMQAGAALWGGLIGFGAFGVFMYWAREYLLYLIKAGHIVALVHLLHDKPLPPEISQMAYASGAVKARFAQASVLFAIDRLIVGVVKALSGLVHDMMTMASLPGAQPLAAVVHAFLRMAVGFVDEVILARTIHADSDNPWSAARDALILYGQNYKRMMKNAAWLALMVYAFSALVFLLMLAPATLLVYLMPGAWSAAAIVFALLLAWSIKVALLEPFAMTCLMDVYFQTIRDQQPDLEWEARLEQMSGKFRTLTEQACNTTNSAGQKLSDRTQTA